VSDERFVAISPEPITVITKTALPKTSDPTLRNFMATSLPLFDHEKAHATG
jgi:hypothetical protein